MPKLVKLPKNREFIFRAGRKGGEAKYDWDSWFNGDLLLLEQSVGKKNEKGEVTEVEDKKDYEVSTNTMIGKVKFAARNRYKVVEVSRFDADQKPLKDAFIIRAREMDSEEREVEDLRRAEVKEVNKARRAAALAEGANGHEEPEDEYTEE